MNDDADLEARWAEIFRPKPGGPVAQTALFTAERVRARMLFSGQGMANFIEIFKKKADKIPQATVLIDFGQGNSSNGPAIDTVVGVLDDMDGAGFTPRIDVVIISHQDKDHWGLLGGFIKAVEDKMWELKVGQIYFGGADWGASAARVVTRLEAFSDNAAEAIANDCCNYKKPNGAIGELVTVAGVAFRLLACNISLSGVATRSITRNATSAVVALDFAGNRIIFPGDATFQTMTFVNERLVKWKKSPVQPVFALAVPHHGAIATFAQRYTSTPDFTIGTAFAKLMNAQNAVASAGVLSHHHHPVLSVLEVFEPYTDADDKHTIVAYNYPKSKFYEYSVKTSIYTLVIKLPPDAKTLDRNFTLTDSALQGGPGALLEAEPPRRLAPPPILAPAPVFAPPPALAADAP